MGRSGTSSCAGFLIQRAFRGAIRGDAEDRTRVMLHGPWIAGLMLTWLTWFMLLKGLKKVPVVKWINQSTLETYGVFPVLILLWFSLTMLIALLLRESDDPAHLLHRRPYDRQMRRAGYDR